MPFGLSEMFSFGKKGRHPADKPVAPIAEPYVVKEKTIGQMTTEALNFAIAHATSHAVIVDTAGSTIDQSTLAKAYLEKYKGRHLTVEEFAREIGHSLTDEENSVVITGYSSDLVEKNKELERDFQSAVRGFSFDQRNPEPGKRAKSLIILSDGIPHHETFSDADMPWFNGPFTWENDVWSINTPPDIKKIDLIHQRETSTRLPDKTTAHAWTPSQSYSFK